MLNVFGSMSTNTGLAPTLWIVPAVAKNVNGVVMTSSPWPQSSARSASSSASVPLAQPTAYFVCDSSATSALELLDGSAEDEQLGVDDLHHRGNDFIADRRVLCTEIQQRDRHCQDRKNVIAPIGRRGGTLEAAPRPAKSSLAQAIGSI